MNKQLQFHSSGTVHVRSRQGSEGEGESRTIDVHVRTLRQKLGDGGALIKTIRNVGYRMDEHPEAGES